MGGEHRGAEAMQRNLWWKIGKHFKVEAQPDELRVLDDGDLLVTGHYRGVARRSGRALDAEFTHVLRFDQDGRITSLRQLTDTAAWIDALGADAPLETIDYSVTDGVATVCLDRPDQRNAIDLRMGEETLVVARRIASDASVRAVLICGNGPALTVGGDIGYFLESPPEEFGNLFARMTTPFHEAFRILSRIDAPIVTAAHGSVAGGGLGYVYAADIVLAAEGTQFVTAFAGIGLSGDGGGTWHLPRLIGPARAARAYLQNRPITAEQALDWGMISEIVPAEELRARAAALAASLAQGPTRAFGRMRTLLRETWDNDLSRQLLAETEGDQGHRRHRRRRQRHRRASRRSAAPSSKEGRKCQDSSKIRPNTRQFGRAVSGIVATVWPRVLPGAGPQRSGHRRTVEGPRSLGPARRPPSGGVRRRGWRHGRSRRRRGGTGGSRDAHADLGHLTGDLRQHPCSPRLRRDEAGMAARLGGRIPEDGLRADRTRRRIQQPQGRHLRAAHRRGMEDLRIEVLHLGRRSGRCPPRGGQGRRTLHSGEERAVAVRGSHRQSWPAISEDRDVDRVARTVNSPCSSTTSRSATTR